MQPYRAIRRFLWKASMSGLPRGPHITRYFMYQRLGAIAPLLGSRTGRVLAVSRSAKLCGVLGLQATEVVEANYPDHDMLALKFADASFDFILSDQVLEHVEGNPQQAIDECRRVLKPGGVVLHTTCFINPVHLAPRDFWRFTPEALRWLHRNWSEIIECGGWGNLGVWSIVQDGLRHEKIPHATWHPLHRLAMKNDPAWPIVTWVLARR